jgi:hypothetical protein
MVAVVVFNERIVLCSLLVVFGRRVLMAFRRYYLRMSVLFCIEAKEDRCCRIVVICDSFRIPYFELYLSMILTERSYDVLTESLLCSISLSMIRRISSNEEEDFQFPTLEIRQRKSYDVCPGGVVKQLNSARM